MELWTHEPGNVWGKEPLPETFPLPEGQGLIGYLGKRVRYATKDCYVVFSPAEDEAVVNQFSPFARCDSAWQILEWIGNALTLGQKIVGFVPVYVDLDRKSTR